MARQLGDWLNGYMEYTYRSEPPESYHLWTGISVIAGALQRKVYMPFNMDRIFPNMYVALVGPSGRARKSTAIAFGMDLLRRISGVKVTAQLVTPQMLIQDIKGTVATYDNPSTGKIEYHCSMTIMSSELSVFLGMKNLEFLSILTSMYDSEKEWEYRTKTSGVDKITGICLNMLGGTAPDWINSMIPQEALGGGFTSRFVFVVERDKGKIIPDPTPTPRQVELREILSKDLERIHLMSGQMRFEEVARDAYEDWYVEQSAHPPIPGKYFDGYCARRATHVKKLGMIMSASRGDDMIISLDDLQRAMKVLESAEATMPQAFSGLGKARYVDVTDTILSYMLEAGKRKFAHSELLKIFYRDIDAWTLGVVMQTLSEMKVIQMSLPMDGSGEKIYELVGAVK